MVMSRWMGAAVLVGIFLVGGCGDGTPTSSNEDLLPGVSTHEVIIPYAEFAEGVSLYSGFGSPANLAAPAVAHSYKEELEARALLNFATPPRTVRVPEPGDTVTVADSTFVPVSGTLVLLVDALDHVEGTTVELALGALSIPFDHRTASWEMAVDTLGGESPWPEPGAGTAREVDVVEWDPAEGDTVRFQVDSVTATEWAVRDVAERGSARIESRTEGTLLQVREATFVADVRSDINPDTLVTFSSEWERTTVVYTPSTQALGPELLIGGAPAWRTYLSIAPPVRLDPGADYCEGIPCPVDLTAENLIYAGLVLTTSETLLGGFQPVDSLRVQARAVISPERVPRSPLGPPVQSSPRVIPPAAFGVDGATTVEISMSGYVRQLLRDSSGDEDPPAGTLAIFSAVEAGALQYGTFRGPGQEGEPALRLIFTLFEGVRLP